LVLWLFVLPPDDGVTVAELVDGLLLTTSIAVDDTHTATTIT